jgi:hypothetical protein
MRLSQLRATGTDRKWWVLAAMTGSLAMILLDTMMIGVALPTIELARAVQGASAAAMIPASLAIVVDAFPPGERGRAPKPPANPGSARRGSDVAHPTWESHPLRCATKARCGGTRTR